MMAQAAAALTGKVLLAAIFQMFFARRNTDWEADESSSEAEGSDAARGSSESDDEILTRASPPMKKA